MIVNFHVVWYSLHWKNQFGIDLLKSVQNTRNSKIRGSWAPNGSNGRSCSHSLKIEITYDFLWLNKSPLKKPFYQLLLQDSWACIQQHDLLFEFQKLSKHCNTNQLVFSILQMSFDQFQLFLFVHLWNTKQFCHHLEICNKSSWNRKYKIEGWNLNF